MHGAAVVAAIDEIVPRLVVDDLLHYLLRVRVIQG